MSDIVYEINSSRLNYEDYCEVVLAAHEIARKKFNIDSSTGNITPEIISKLIAEKNGVTISAFHGDTLVGVSLLIFYTLNKRYFKGNTCEAKYVAVHPKYQGKGIARNMLNKVTEYASSRNIDGIVTTINALNTPSINLHKGCGYIPVDTYIGYHNHRTIKLFKWLKPKPHNNSCYKMVYRLKACKVKLIMKLKGYK